MKNLLKVGAIFLSLNAISFQVKAMSIDWTGNYRFELAEVDMPYLTSVPQGAPSDKGRKSYSLNHLNLSPKIIAFDGFNIVANIEMFPSGWYPGSQVGTDFGGNAVNYSFATEQSQSAVNVEVNQLYINWNQEYGAFVAGRIPIHFGLGVAHNSGGGLFDHWTETHDLFGYKFQIGNLSITPMLGRTFHAYPYAQGAMATEQIWDVEYSNPEIESTLSFFYQLRSSSNAGNDATRFFKPYDSGTPVSIGGNNTTLVSFYFARGWEKFKFRVEASSYLSGGTGVQYSTGTSEIKMSGYGFALEFEFPNPESKTQWMLRMGVASGDDPKTDNFEGFAFNKNYDIAFLLFNHPLGQNNYDVLRTKLFRQRSSAGSVYSNDQTVDEEALSNAMYVSPKFSYAVNDKLDWTNAFTYAIAQVNPSVSRSDVASDIGFEWDFGLTYKPQPKLRWVNEIGFFLPGSVWKEGGANRDANFTYGLQSKVAVSF